MSKEAAKRRKREEGHGGVSGEGGGDDSTAAVSADMMSEMKAVFDKQMLQMKNEMNQQMVQMKADMEQKTTKMQDEIDCLTRQIEELTKDEGLLDHRFDFWFESFHADYIAEMQEEIDRLKADRDEAAVSKIDNWEYPLSIDIPVNYWIDQGFDLAYSRAVNELLCKIKCMTRDMRRGRYVHKIDLDMYYIFENESEHTILIHDDILLPHWRQLTDALKEYDYPDPPEYLCLSDIQLIPEVIDMLTRALAATNIKDVSMFRLDFAQEPHGIDFANKTLQDNLYMRNFCWKNNRFSNIQHANDLVEVIGNHPYLKQIDMSGCFNHGDHGHDILCRLLTGNKYERVRFCNNNVITSGSAHIPDYIATNPSLTHLNLQTNHLDDNDASLIARALKQNTKLKILCLGENDITEVGIDALKKAIFDPSSTLNSAVSSNHTCRIRGIGLEEYFYDKFSTKKQTRGRKIYSLLSRRATEGVSAYHLEMELGEDSLELAPYVLSSVNVYKERYISLLDPVKKPAAIVYDILRNWKMPELYDIRRSPKKKL